MNWLQKIGMTRGKASPQGLRFYLPEESGPFDAIYQSPDFPHVFLGSSDPDDIQKAKKLAGQPICCRFDLAAAQNEHLPHADFAFSLPEYPVWGEQEQQETQPEFQKAINILAKVIETRNCPIYVHCVAGMNRSVAVLAGAISRLTKRPVKNILQEIKSRRGSVGLHDSYLQMLSLSSPYDEPDWRQQIQDELNVEEGAAAA